MRKHRAWALILFMIIFGAAFVQANPQSEYLDSGFQSLLYHAIRLEESFPSVNPVGMAITEFEKAARETLTSEANLMLGLIYRTSSPAQPWDITWNLPSGILSRVDLLLCG